MATVERQNLYDLLGAPRDATPEALKRAYRERARELHPDVSTDPEAVDRFSEISRAYEILCRPASRLLYDRFGYTSAADIATGPREPGAPPPAHAGRPSPAEEPVSAPTGEREPRPGAEAVAQTASAEPRPRVVDLDVTPLEAISGTRRRIPSDGWRRARLEVPARAYDGQVLRLADGGHVRLRVRDRDTRLIRAAAAVGAIFAAALFVVVAVAGNSL